MVAERQRRIEGRTGGLAVGLGRRSSATVVGRSGSRSQLVGSRPNFCARGHPERVEVVHDRGVFVNTGRTFLEGFDYLYDAVGGYVGYGWNRRLSSSQGGVTPGLSSAR